MFYSFWVWVVIIVYRSPQVNIVQLKTPKDSNC